MQLGEAFGILHVPAEDVVESDIVRHHLESHLEQRMPG